MLTGLFFTMKESTHTSRRNVNKKHLGCPRPNATSSCVPCKICSQSPEAIHTFCNRRNKTKAAMIARYCMSVCLVYFLVYNSLAFSPLASHGGSIQKQSSSLYAAMTAIGQYRRLQEQQRQDRKERIRETYMEEIEQLVSGQEYHLLEPSFCHSFSRGGLSVMSSLLTLPQTMGTCCNKIGCFITEDF
jgi:hypothetical protein